MVLFKTHSKIRTENFTHLHITFCTPGKKKNLKHYKAWFVVEVTAAAKVTPNFKKNVYLSKGNKGSFVCVMFMNLSKTLDTMHHDLLIAN